MASSRKKNSRKQRDSRRKHPPPDPITPESGAAEGVTVAWMLSALGAGFCELVAMLAMAALAYPPVADYLPERAIVLPWLLIFVAAITGTFSLLLTPMVLRQRKTPPPTSVINFAVFVGVLAWALVLGSMWF